MSGDFDKKRSALTISTASLEAYSDELKKSQQEQNLSMKGWMKKKSPATFKGWQKRYFMTIENPTEGWKLVYFDDDKTDTKPNGALDLGSLTSISQKGKKEFTLQFPTRIVELKVKTAELRQQWINCLNNCKQQAQMSRVKRPLSMDLNVKSQEQSPTKGDHKKVDTVTAQQAQMVKEQQQQIQQRGSILLDPIKIKRNSGTQLSNEKMIELIGLKDCIKNMNEQFINQRMIYGYLGKRSKGKVKYFQKRWFILVSAKPLYQEYNDEKILFESQLPAWLELDTITYFKQKEEGKPPKAKGDVKMLDCQEIIIKNMQKSKENGFTFKLNMGDRLYHLMAESEIERTKWQMALGMSIKTTKEINNPLKIKIKKNIDPIIIIYDQQESLIQRREIIQQKLQNDLNRFIKINDFNSLLTSLTDIKNDMFDSMQACIVKDPQRKDILKEYTDNYHEKICQLITDYWDKEYQQFESPNLLRLAYWIWEYQVQMKDFLNDDRLLFGIRVLLNIYVNRSLESIESNINSIIQLEKNCEAFENEHGQLISQTPIDLFKFINEGYDLGYRLCSCKETSWRFGGFGKVILQQYQEGLQEMIDEQQLNIIKLISICNNTLCLYDNTKNYALRLQQNITEEECEKVFDQQKITKGFINIANNCREIIFNYYFGKIGIQFRKFYLDIIIIDILKQVIEPASQSMSQLHDSFSRKLWKQLLDVILQYYFNQFIISCSKAKKEHFNEFINKLEQDKDILFSELETFIFEKILQISLKPFDDMIKFLNEDSINILEPLKALRVYFGRSFTDKTVKSIMQLRFDMDKETKKDTLDVCKGLLDDINKNEPKVDMIQQISVLGEEESEEQQEQQQQRLDSNRRGDIILDLEEDDINMSPNQIQQKPQQIQNKEYIDEGFLHKKKPKQKAWDYRYFRIRKGYMYWYINENSREAQNKINLQDLDEVIQNQKKQTNFTLTLEGGKIYKFKTQSKEECELWIETIMKEQNQTDNITVQIEAIKIGNGKKPIIQDYDEIARKEKQKLKQEERKRKRIEKENEKKRRQQELNQQKQQQQIKELGDIKPKQNQVDIIELQGDPIKQKQTVSCWTSFLIALGVERPK